jgi:tRNA(His) 5'-end guanylyltransferase
MNVEELDARMRAGECFHSLKAPIGTFIVVRVDGRSFSKLTERLTEKPFDSGFHQHMVAAASGLLETLGGTYAYTESDEISVVLPRASALFDREVEKLVSISASRAAAVVSIGLGEPVEFDARLWIGAQEQDVIDYFRWRQSDCGRCALNGWCYWLLR